MKGQAWPGGHRVQEVALPEEKVPWKERIIQRGHATSQHKVTTLLYEGMRVVLG